MIPSAGECPDEAQLSDFLAAPDSDHQLSRHIDACPTCRATLDALSDSTELASYLGHFNAQRDSSRFLEEPLRPDDLGSLQGLAIEAEIGKGGMGTVFRAWDESLKRFVAVKVLHRYGSEEATARFLRESRAMASLEHENVVGVFSNGCTSDGTPFLVMPLIEGLSLKEKLASGPMSALDAATIIRQVALGLNAAHRQGVIHRDVKPENILLDCTDQRAKVTDFGLAGVDDEGTLTKANIVGGTPMYMSPEQINTPAVKDERLDVYSLGITLYECLTGTPPFKGTPLQILEQHCSTEPIQPSRLNPNIPRDVENICLMAIAKEPSNRYRTAALFADDLERFIEGRPVHAKETTSLQKLRMWCGRNPALAGSLLLSMIVLCLGTAVSTTLWIQSSRNAAKAQHYFEGLEDSRDRLRQSVSRFQQRVFSQESMHWQMSKQFREQMFADVITYLDEFALTEKSNRTGSQNHSEFLALTRDYYEVAKAALEVDQLEQSQLAITRALTRVRSIGTDDLECSLLHADIAATAIDAMLIRLKDEVPIQSQDTLPSLANEVSEAAKLSFKMAPKDPRAAFVVLQAECYELFVAPAPEPQKVNSLYEKLTTLESPQNTKRLERLSAAIRLSHDFFGKDSERAAPLLIRNAAGPFESLRNAYRTERISLYPTDFMLGQNQFLLAEHHFLSEDMDLGNIALNESIKHFNEAVLGNPQNRSWRVMLAEAFLVACDRSMQNGDSQLAEQQLIKCIRTYMHIRELEPGDAEVGINVIKLFIKLAEIRAGNGKPADCANEFNIASQDIRLLPNTSEFDFWRDEVRPWCISQSLLNIEQADPENPIIVGLQARWRSTAESLEQNRSKPELILLIKLRDKEMTPKRPEGLKIETLRKPRRF